METEETIFSREDLSNMVSVTEVNETDFLESVKGKKSDEVGNNENLKQKTENITGQKLDENEENKQTDFQQGTTSGTDQKTSESGPIAAAPTGFEINLSMIPGAIMLDLIDGAIRRTEDIAEMTFKVRNVPGLGLLPEQKKMLENIADECMKDAKVNFKTPWHALGAGLLTIVVTNAVLGRWEKTDGKVKVKEFESVGKNKKMKIKSEPTYKKTDGRGRPKKNPGEPKSTYNKKSK